MKASDLFKGTSGNVLIGVGIALAAPLVWPIIAAAGRPLAKSVIRGYLALADTVKESVAETGEKLSDLVAEVRAEREGVAETPAPSPGQRVQIGS